MRRSLVLFVALLVLIGGAPSADESSIAVGSAIAHRGEAVQGWIDVVAGPGAASIRIPVTVVNGVRPGPVLALIAGTHGYEYTSVIALPMVAARLAPGQMMGAVILVHMANPPSFFGRTIYYGPDGRNLNRVYPGKAEGTVSERIAAALMREVILKATHLADMHCGDGNESLRPYSYWMISGNPAVDNASREMALAYGFDHIVVDRDRPRDPNAAAYTANAAILGGRPAITTESGGMGLTDEASVRGHVTGALSLIAHLGIMKAPSARVEKPLWVVRSEVVRAPAAGVWYPLVEKSQRVAAGTLLGRITDPFGVTLHEIRAPFGGEILYVVATPPVAEGEPLAYVGEISEIQPAP